MTLTLSLASLWALLIAAAIPFLTGYLTGSTWPPLAKWVVVIVVSVVVGVGTLAVQDGTVWTWANAGALVAGVMGVAQTWYFVLLNNLPTVKKWLASHGVGAKTP